MARLARVVAPTTPYHITHGGNRRCRVFFEDEDRDAYPAFLERYCRTHALDLWAWCLMTNHIHLLAWPQRKESVPFKFIFLR